MTGEHCQLKWHWMEISTRDASIFHFSWAIKQSTIHRNIPRHLSNLSFCFVFFCPASAALIRRLPGPPRCRVVSSGVEKIPAIRMSEHVLQHRAWWEKQTLHHMKPTSASGQPWMWSIGFPIFNFSLCFQFSLTANDGWYDSDKETIGRYPVKVLLQLGNCYKNILELHGPHGIFGGLLLLLAVVFLNDVVFTLHLFGGCLHSLLIDPFHFPLSLLLPPPLCYRPGLSILEVHLTTQTHHITHNMGNTVQVTSNSSRKNTELT